MTHRKWLMIVALVVGITLILVLVIFKKPVVAPTTNIANGNRSAIIANTAAKSTLFSTADLPDRDSHYSFFVNIPETWAAEYVPASQAINFFDPAKAAAATNLVKSKIFVTFYEGQDFQPSTYNLEISAARLTKQLARRFSYHLPATVKLTAAPGWPVWAVIEDHNLIHLRTGSSTPYTFFIFHQAPDLPDQTFSDIINSLKFNI